MKVLTPRCPECGALARGTLDVISGCAEMNLDENGEGEFTGRCSAVLSNGKRCPNEALPGSRYCGLEAHQALALDMEPRRLDRLLDVYAEVTR